VELLDPRARPEPARLEPHEARGPSAAVSVEPVRARIVASLIAVTALLLAGAVPGLQRGSEAAPLPVRVTAANPLPRVGFVAPAGGSILVHATYPKVVSPCLRPVQPLLHRRFAGTIEVGKDREGKLFLVGVLPLEEYLRGIAEVPRTWPMEALKAQVVAARSYALNRLRTPDETGRALGYQLCATDACQVYVGLGIADGPYGDRWRAAVSATSGQALLYQGRPADTVYSSTSNGHTYGNEDVFGGAPLPYLRPIVEGDDGQSPLSHWQARLPFADLNRFLRAGGLWSGAKIVTAFRRGPSVVVRGPKGSTGIDVVTFRSSLNYWSHCLEPDRYPGTDTDGSALPQAIPSRWFGTTLAGRTLVMQGRGWGHGVGMVQWGAKGKADRGLRYGDILAAYYGGLHPQRIREPGLIRIGIATGLTTVRLSGTEGVRVQGRTPGSGPWLVTGGKRLRVVRARPSSIPTSIEPGRLLRGPRRITAGRPFSATVTLPQLSVSRLVLRVDGEDRLLGRPVTFQAGTYRLHGIAPTVPSGTYRLSAIVTDGVDIARTVPRRVRLVGGPAVGPSPSPSASATPVSRPAGTPAALPTGGGAGWAAPWIAGGAVAAAGLAVLWMTRRRRPAGGAKLADRNGPPG
jgi:stage II sporulation protein D (peptidoglycan lytic transglycosylase)